MLNTMKSYHSCGHMAQISWTGDDHFSNPARASAIETARREGQCRQCQRAATLVTPAGATAQAALVNAVETGWSDAEITAGTRFNNEQTFICAGCRNEFPQSLAMNANLGMSCPNCYDRLSDI